MGSLNPFKKPKMPAPPPLPKEVTQSPEEKAAMIAEQQEADKKKRYSQRGRAATMLTGGRGVMGDDSSGLATKRLLGG